MIIMKIINNIARLIISIYISTLFITSCANDIEMSEDNIQLPHTVKMTLNGTFIDFEGASTRASSKEWVNGDILFLEFYTSKGSVYGKAVYDDNNTGEWIVSYYGNLDRNSEMKVDATFFDNPSLNVENDVVWISPTTPIYWTEESGTAIYSSSNELSITLKIQPGASRIRFKGKPGDNLAVGGIKFYECFYPDSFLYNSTEDFAYLTVNESGYTDYLYDYNEGVPTEQIKINKQEEDGWDYLYTMDCTENMRGLGKSGWMNIPTPTNHNGWTRKQVTGEENGHMWVDLGLPSGTLWADENIGADIAQWQEDEKESNVYGEEFYWGQTSSDIGYTGSENIQGSDSYDTAKWEWKGNWVMPNKEDYEELLQFCILKIANNTYGTINTIEVRGCTGEVINFPYDNNSNGTTYWTSSHATKSMDEELNDIKIGRNREYAYVLDIDNLGKYQLTKTLSYYSSMVGGGDTRYTYFAANIRTVIK